MRTIVYNIMLLVDFKHKYCLSMFEILNIILIYVY